MKKTIILLALAASATTLTAAQLVEAIVIRVGDRIITRTQYDKRLHDAFSEIEQTSAPGEVAAKKGELHNREEMSDKELRERYDREKERYRLPEPARLREIVILRPENAAQVDAARQRANQIAARAKTEDFAKLASEASEAGTKSKGGDLGEVARGELLPDLDKAVFNSPAGTVIGPLESKSAWHILKVE